MGPLGLGLWPVLGGRLSGGGGAPVEPLPFNAALEGDSQTIWAGSWAHQFIADNPTFDAQIFANSGSALGLPANAGDGGNTLWGRTAAVLADLPSHVAFLIGGNDDAQRGGSATAYFDAIVEYTDYLEAQRPGLRTIAATILPDGGAGGAQQNPNRAIINPLLLAERGARFLDVMDFGGHPLMSDSAPDDVTYFQTDKVHATQPAALALLGSIAKAVLNPIRDERTVESVSFFDNAGDVAGWTNATGVTAGATYEETLIVTGLPPGTTVAASCDVGTLSIGRGAFSTTPGNVGNGQAVTRRITASTTPGATVPQEITIGASVFSPTVTTEAAADTTAPTLSSPTDAKNGQNAMTGSVSTDEGNGTLYWFISTSATPPSAADLKAGTGAVASGSQAVSGTGVQNISDNGLAAATAYYTHYLHRDAAGNDSSIASADGFTTDATPTARVAYIRLGGAAPASNWNAPTNLFTTGTQIANIKDSAEVNTGWTMVIDNVFDGTSSGAGSVSTVAWVPSAVMDAPAYCDTSTAVWRFTGLNPAKTYTLDFASCRTAGTTRNTVFTVEGVGLPQINSSYNDDAVATASNVSPGGDGEISITMSIGSPNDISFAYVNAVRITENG